MKKANNIKLTLLVLLGLMLIQVGCARQGGKTNDKPDEPGLVEDTEQMEALGQTEVKQVTPKINIFIENSASMNGFINDASEFQNATTALTSMLKKAYGPENLNPCFINASIIPKQGQDPYQVVKSMLVKSSFTGTGNTGTTDLNKLIKLVLDNTDENTLSFFISDCIYSLKNTGATPTLLEGCQNETMDYFNGKLKELSDLSVLFVRMESNFKGGYWDYKNPSGPAKIKLKNCKRPYYLCIVGTDGILKEFTSNIHLEDLKGYSCQYYLSGKDYSNTFYTAISRPHKSGAFIVEDGTTLRLKSSGAIQFAIAMNLDDFSMSEEEKINPANYEIDGNFNIVEILPIDNNMFFSPNEKNNILSNGCTHLVVVSSDGYPSDFTIKFKPSIPEWVNVFSSTDDTGISDDNENELKKTFGIFYFINGVASAYERDSYFTMNIKINH